MPKRWARLACAVFGHKYGPAETENFGIFGNLQRKQCLRCGDMFAMLQAGKWHNQSKTVRLLHKAIAASNKENVTC